MKAELVDSDRVRKMVEVRVDDHQIDDIRKDIYDDLKKHAKIKGFRPGKVPKSILNSYYKDFINDEIKRKVVESTMFEALKKYNIDPLVEPIVDFKDVEDSFVYSIDCEVAPEIELPSYKGIEVEIEPISVSEDEIQRRIESLRDMHAQMIAKEGNEGAEKGDFAVIKYQGYIDGKPVKGIYTEAYPVELGKTTLMPEFENGLYGMNIGDEKEIRAVFPSDYPDKDIAEKEVVFSVSLKDLREIRLPEINDDFAKDLGFDDAGKLNEGIRAELEKEKEVSQKQFISQKIIQTIVEKSDIPVPARLLDKRLDAMLEDAMSQYGNLDFKEDEMEKMESDFRKSFQGNAENRIRTDFILSEIATAENITVDDSDVEERMKKFASDTGKTYEEIKEFYENNNMIENIKNSILLEKALDLLRESAVLKEKI